jgi:hypothetical protein
VIAVGSRELDDCFGPEIDRSPGEWFATFAITRVA